jgi:probable phosphoglycerate mutase
MPKIIIVRHGQSQANASGRSGNAGTWLTQQGQGDASRAARGILREHGHRPLAVVSSPYRRARQTAAPLARALGVKVQVQPGVHERDLGHLVHVPADQWANEPGYLKPGTTQVDPDYKPKNGESLKDVQKRAVAGLHDAIRKNPGKDIVLFTHGHTARALEAHLKGTWEGGVNWKNGEHRSYDYDKPVTVSEIVEALIEGCEPRVLLGISTECV